VNTLVDLSILNFKFVNKPLLIGGKALEYYGIRKAGSDIDLVISIEDHKKLVLQFPSNIKDLFGDIGICEYGFEIWNQICRYTYYELKPDAIELDTILVASIEKLILLKTLAIHIPKYYNDLILIKDYLLKEKYK
jgi:hypothetical protein